MSILRAVAAAGGSLNMGLTSGVYGSALQIPVINVTGTNITNITTVAITTALTPGLIGAVPTTLTVGTSGSLTGGGTLAADLTLTLVNDALSPGINKYYGTSISGVKGYFSLPSGSGGGGGSGTVTTLSAGTGITFTPSGTITTSGVIAVDTTIVPILLSSALAPGAVVFAGAGGTLTNNSSAFYWNGAVTGGTSATALNIDTAGDFSGTDSLNVYYQVDAYLPNSLVVDTDNSSQVPGLSVSTSRGTGAAPSLSVANDLIGKVGYWAYSGASPAYNEHANIKAYVTGATAANLGGELRLATKADNGVLATALTINNSQGAVFSRNATIASGVVVQSGGLTVIGTTTISGAVTISSAVIVQAGGITVSGNSTISGSFTTASAIIVQAGGLTVVGSTTISGAVTISSAVIIQSGGLTVTGNTQVSGVLRGNSLITTGSITTGAVGGTGSLIINGTTSGTATLTVPAAAGTTTVTFPSSAPTASNILRANSTTQWGWIDNTDTVLITQVFS